MAMCYNGFNKYWEDSSDLEPINLKGYLFETEYDYIKKFECTKEIPKVTLKREIVCNGNKRRV